MAKTGTKRLNELLRKHNGEGQVVWRSNKFMWELPAQGEDDFVFVKVLSRNTLDSYITLRNILEGRISYITKKMRKAG